MVWLHGDTAEELQKALRRLRRTELLRSLLPVWNVMGVHRDAEFNRSHRPGLPAGYGPQGLAVPVPVRAHAGVVPRPGGGASQDARRPRTQGAAFTGVLANTVASFALGDYEWLLPLEADELTDLVDMMRDLRYHRRSHVREGGGALLHRRRLRFDEIADVLQ